MMAQIDSDNSLLKASYFGISQILVEIAIGPASGIVFGMVFALLLSPVILVASVIIFALLSPKTATGHYHSYFNRAPLHLIFRPFIILFPVVALPVLASFACKLLSQSSALLPIFGIVILCLSLVITLFS